MRDFNIGGRRSALRARLANAVDPMQARALALDAEAAFPAAEVQAWRDMGLLAAALPVEDGGLGLGTEPEGASEAMQALRLIGRGNLAAGRIFEAHVNALRLIALHAAPALRRRVAASVRAGRLFGLWVTDDPDAPVTLDAAGTLHGTKAPCSGAGHIHDALITARLGSGDTHLVVVTLAPGHPAGGGAWPLQGMRAACNGSVMLDGIAVPPDAILGGPGTYLEQPEFSAGAWRGMAVALGGMEALTWEMRRILAANGRAGEPHQRQRIGLALIALETARLWVRRAALLAETGEAAPDDIANTVNLGRIAVEHAGLELIRLAQRSLGLAAFRAGSLVELLLRDLGTYLRQPAPDSTLGEAAAHFTQRDVPAEM